MAIKVLPEHIAKRDSRAVASLNHPHICVLHDISSHDGAGDYRVME